MAVKCSVVVVLCTAILSAMCALCWPLVLTLLCLAGDGGYPGGWEGQPNYGMPPGYPAYDYSAYYGQQAAPAPAYGAYGQPPTAYPMPDPYAQAYAAAAAGGAPPPAVPSTGQRCRD